MALTPGYEYDIFISYAHVDNVGFPGQADGWIEQFYKNLDLMLTKRFGRADMVKIWWDSKKLDGSVLFDNSIEEGIKKSALMICLNSPGYAASDYCKKELETFYQKASTENARINVGNRSRIIHVLLNNIPFKDWPIQLSGTSGFPFHDANESGDFGDTLDTYSIEFRKQMQNVRDAVWNILTDFKKIETTPEVQKSSTPEADSDTFTIYLGEVADTLRAPRKRIITELEKKGYKILTGVPPPDEEEAHELATKKAIEKANLAIHLLDEYPGREIVGASDLWYPQKQAELGMQSGKSQMIWVPAEMEIENIDDEKYKTFLQNIEAGKSSSKGFEFIRGSKSTLAQEIVDYAEQLKAQQVAKPVEKGSLPVLLDTHFVDQMYAIDLYRTLLENQIQPYLNSQEDDPRKNINFFGDRISQVKKLIFLYGSVSKEWVLERMSAALQLIITNNYQIDDFYVYMAPPHKEAGGMALNQRFLKVNVVDYSNQQIVDNGKLQEFLTNLKV